MHRLFFWRRKRAKASATEFLLPDQIPFSPSKSAREVERLDGQHQALREVIAGNYVAPLAAPTAVLDIGCGTGRWAMEMAVEFPQAQVVGLDLIAPQPEGSLGDGIDAIPANARFMQADATQPLPFSDASFDYVHLCMLYAVLPAANWGPLLGECRRVTRAGGWVESVEALPVSNPTEWVALATITLWFSELLRQRGADPLAALKMPSWFRACGLTNLGSLEVTAADEDDHEDAIRSAGALIDYIRAPVIAAGISTAEQFETIAAQALTAVRYSSKGSGFNTYVVYGQRPDDG